jgi:hypothetical protein
LLELKRYLFVYEPIAIQSLNEGDRPPMGGGGVELGGRVWYNVKVLHIRYNLFAGTETLSLSIYGPIAMQMFAWEDRPPNLGGRGGVRGSSVVPREGPS